MTIRRLFVAHAESAWVRNARWFAGWFLPSLIASTLLLWLLIHLTEGGLRHS